MAKARVAFSLWLTMGSFLLAGGFFDQGVKLYQEGKSDAAIVAFKRAIKEDPHNARSYFNIGFIYQEKGKVWWKIAEGWYRKALRENPKLLEGYFNLGVLFFQEGEYEKAKKMFEITYQLNPKDQDVKKALREVREKVSALSEPIPEKPATAPKESLSPAKKVEKGAVGKGVKQEEKKPTQPLKATKPPLPSSAKGGEKKPLPSKKEVHKEPQKKGSAAPQEKVHPSLVQRFLLAEDVVKSEPVGVKDQFTGKEPKIFVFLELRGLSHPGVLRVLFRSPSGKVAYAYKKPLEVQGSRQRVWTWRNCRGYRFCAKGGKWKVEVYLDDLFLGSKKLLIAPR